MSWKTISRYNVEMIIHIYIDFQVLRNVLDDCRSIDLVKETCDPVVTVLRDSPGIDYTPAGALTDGPDYY